MIAKMAKLLEKSKTNQILFSLRKENKVFYQRSMGESIKRRTFAKAALVVQRIE